MVIRSQRDGSFDEIFVKAVGVVHHCDGSL
jgi:hypothetical protein